MGRLARWLGLGRRRGGIGLRSACRRRADRRRDSQFRSLLLRRRLPVLWRLPVLRLRLWRLWISLRLRLFDGILPGLQLWLLSTIPAVLRRLPSLAPKLWHVPHVRRARRSSLPPLVSNGPSGLWTLES